MATTTRCCDTEYPHYHAAAPSLTTSAAAQAGASFWVGSLALRASSFRREHPPTGTGQAVPICILAAHHLNNGEAPKHQEQVNAEEWPLQLTVAGVCTLRQAHVAVLKTAVPLLFHVLSAAAPPQSTTTLPAGPEPPTYLATLISQLRSNTQAAVVRLGRRTLMIMPTGRALMGFLVSPAAVDLTSQRSLAASSLLYRCLQQLRAEEMEEEAREGLPEIGSTDHSTTRKKRSREEHQAKEVPAPEEACTKRRALSPPEEPPRP